jgi:hypothetical protein
LTLRDPMRRAGRGEKIRVRRLLVGDRAGQRNHDRAKPDGSELRDGDRAAATNNQVGPRVARRHVIDERDALGIDVGIAIRRAQQLDMLGARLMDNHGSNRFVHARERGGYALVQRLRAEAAADDQQSQRSVAICKALVGGRQSRNRIAQRIADPARLFRVTAGERVRKAQQDSIGAVRKNAIRKTGNGVGVVQHEGPTCGDAHQRARKRRKAPEAQHDRRFPPAHDRYTVDAGSEQRVRPEQQRAQPFAAHAAKRNAFEFDPVLRNELRLETAARPQPEHRQTARNELRGDGEARKNVAAGAPRGDHHCRTHTEKPLNKRRFS